MDSELKKYLDAKFQEVSENSSRNHEQTRQEVGAIRRSVWVLWNQVFGSDPPPPAPGQDPSHVLALKPEDKDLLSTPKEAKPLRHKVSNHDLDIASLQSMVITVNQKMDDTFDELKKQSKEMAVGKKGRDYLFTKQGAKDVSTILAGLTGFITACGTLYAIMTGRLPLPSNPVPASIQAPATTAQGK